MSRGFARALISTALLCTASCGDAGGRHMELALELEGRAARQVSIRGGSVQLTVASVALGPLYLCASVSAEAELCETGVGEWLGATSFDALRAQPMRVGTLTTVTGAARSAQLDYGISWLLTRTAPAASAGSADGHSAILEGTADGDDGSSVRFRAAIDIAPLSRGGAALSLRLAEHELESEDTLRLSLDPSAWLARIRYADLQALDVDGDGEVEISGGDQAYEAIVQSMTGPGAPKFEWSSEP